MEVMEESSDQAMRNKACSLAAKIESLSHSITSSRMGRSPLLSASLTELKHRLWHWCQEYFKKPEKTFYYGHNFSASSRSVILTQIARIISAARYLKLLDQIDLKSYLLCANSQFPSPIKVKERVQLELLAEPEDL